MERWLLNFSRYSLLLGTFVLVFIFFTSNALAVPERGRLRDSQLTPTVDQTRGGTKETATDAARAQQRLRVCQEKEKVVTNRLKSLTALTEQMMKHFDSIAERVENYYTNTVKPSGRTVANYETLVGDVHVKREAARTALATAERHVQEFNCQNDNPRAALNQFREDMQAVKRALFEYRRSIRDLIVAVRGQTEGSTTVTPKPTKAKNGD